MLLHLTSGICSKKAEFFRVIVDCVSFEVQYDESSLIYRRSVALLLLQIVSSASKMSIEEWVGGGLPSDEVKVVV